jgi:hypothetical protein
VLPSEEAQDDLEPEMSEPEAASPETASPETASPEAFEQAAPEPETLKPETSKPEAAKFETSKPKVPESEAPKPASPESKATEIEEPVLERRSLNPEQMQPEQEPLVRQSRPNSLGEHFEKTMPQKGLHVTTPYNNAALSKSMSLNDRFRYQRELFQNDATKMAEMMAIIDSLSSMEEVQEYIRSSMDWDEEVEIVQDFYAMLEEHFI